MQQQAIQNPVVGVNAAESGRIFTNEGLEAIIQGGDESLHPAFGHAESGFRCRFSNCNIARSPALKSLEIAQGYDCGLLFFRLLQKVGFESDVVSINALEP